MNKTGIVTCLGCRNERYDTKSYEIWESLIFEGFPCCNDITFSEIHHNLAQKSPKTRRWEISANYLCKKEQPSWKSEYVGSLRIFKLKYFSIGHDFKPKMEISTDFSVIWRWYKRLVTAFSNFWVKIGGWCGSMAHGSSLKYGEISVFVQFQWVQNTWNIKK